METYPQATDAQKFAKLNLDGAVQANLLIVSSVGIIFMNHQMKNVMTVII